MSRGRSLFIDLLRDHTLMSCSYLVFAEEGRFPPRQELLVNCAWDLCSFSRNKNS